MAGVLLPISVVIGYTDNNLQKLAGGTINSYTAGTTTPINTYTDSTLGTSNGTSLTLDSNGRPTQEMWVAAGTTVKIIVKDSSGNQIGPTLDNISGLNDLGGSASANGPFWGGSAGGSANALTLTFSNGPASYTSGQRITFLATATNSTAATLNVNGLGAKAIQNNTVALVGGEIINGNLYEVEYTGTAFQLSAMVGDPVTIKGTQTVTGAKTFSGSTTVSGSLTATGNVTLSGAKITGGSPIVFEGATADAFQTTVGVTDPTSNQTVTIPNATGTQHLTLAVGGNITAPTDTNENILATITVKGKSMGTTGGLRVKLAWICTNNANVKTARVRFSGIGGNAFGSLALASVAGAISEVNIYNVASASVQSSCQFHSKSDLTFSQGIGTSGAVDTTIDTTIVVTAQKATGGDSIILDRYSAELTVA